MFVVDLSLPAMIDGLYDIVCHRCKSCVLQSTVLWRCSQWSFTMADYWDAWDDNDASECAPSSADERDFRRHQTTIAKHRFRIAAIAGEEDAVQAAFDAAFTRVAPVARRLGRAQGALAACLTSGKRSDLTARLEQLLAECRALGVRMAELGTSTIRESSAEEADEGTYGMLPVYDRTDMEMFLGEEEILVEPPEMMEEGVVPQKCVDDLRCALDGIERDAGVLLERVGVALREVDVCVDAVLNG